jgi:hypothetical protein
LILALYLASKLKVIIIISPWLLQKVFFFCYLGVRDGFVSLLRKVMLIFRFNWNYQKTGEVSTKGIYNGFKEGMGRLFSCFLQILFEIEGNCGYEHDFICAVPSRVV